MVEFGRDYQRRWGEGGRRQRRDQGADAGDPAAAPARPPVPVIHEPHWKWLVIWYFFLGGISGTSFAVGAFARLFGGPDAQQIARMARYVSIAALLPCPPLLIWDLGRPERFLHMLRVVKLRSPMSLGTWGLIAFSGVSALGAAQQAAQDGHLGGNAPARALRRLPAGPVDAVGIAPAFFLAGYTGVLLGATAVPLWARASNHLPPLFMASATSSACAVIATALALVPTTDHATHARMARLEVATLALEAGALAATVRQTRGYDQPLREGHIADVARWGVVGAGIAAPALLRIGARLTGRGDSRALTVATAVATLAGGFCLRYVAIEAGKASARDPQATFRFTARDRAGR
jgi:formate-dependent nitrite reductase membrane component NrfD